MEGKLVRLRPYAISDLDSIMKWINNHEVTRFLGSMAHPLSHRTEEMWLETVAMVSDANHRVFAIESLEGEYLGGIDLRDIDWVARKAALGIAIVKPEYWGKGYGTDAMRLMAQFAFGELNLNRLWLTVQAGNARAIACYEKCGYRREGVLREDWYVDGVYHDMVVMGLLRSEHVK
jgi:RimJ/RimL family protein N-acetyltransferase